MALLWIKFFLALLVIAFCTFLGYLASAKYRQRRSFFSGLFSLNEKYLSELKYSRKPLKEFLSKEDFQGDLSVVLERFLKDRSVKLDCSYLKKEEKEEIYEYFQMLGRGDSHSQSGYFSAKKEKLFSQKEESIKEAKSYTDLYLKLGLLAGLAFVILII